MSKARPARYIRCAFCGTEAIVPSRRGPAPIYCSPAHRQAAYRQRRLGEGRTSSAPARSVRDELEMLRGALREASDASSWAEARRILVHNLEGNLEHGGRSER